MESVSEILELLDLQDIADLMVRGRTFEQLKRLSIGVELAAKPSVLFLDEPTSGLDARFAKMLMEGVRRVADSGRTVICTNHQPSYEVFLLFDSLLLLKRGGETVFFGDCGALVGYFQAVPGVSPLPRDANPATWILECIGACVAGKPSQVDFVRQFNESELKTHLDLTMEEEGVGNPSTAIPALQFRRKRAASSFVQLKLVLLRFVNMYWRSSAHSITILGVAIGTVLVLGLVSSDLSTTTYQGVSSGLGIIFIAFQSQGFVSFNSAIPFAFEDRAAFYRERASHTYSSLWYFLSGALVEIPFVFVKGFIVSIILLLFVGFTSFSDFLLFWLAVSLSILSDVYFGHLLAFVFPNMIMAALAGSVVSTVFFLFVGFNPPGNSIPAGYQWLYTITPQRYAMSILGALVFDDCSTTPVLDVSSTLTLGLNSGVNLWKLPPFPLAT